MVFSFLFFFIAALKLQNTFIFLIFSCFIHNKSHNEAYFYFNKYNMTNAKCDTA